MSKIKQLLNDKESVLVFDVDGVLALMEFGEYTHYILSDEEWDNAVTNGTNYYTEEKVSKKMQDFIKTKDLNRVYVITKARTQREIDFKKVYLSKYYNIKTENVYYVKDDYEKKEKMKIIKEKYQDLDNHKIIMIDDLVTVLSDIMDNTPFSTAHISSFLDI